MAKETKQPCRSDESPREHGDVDQTLKTPAVTSRRLKKRELDRKAQRLARERTKNHIADLEKLVDELRNKDTTGQVHSLTQSLQAVTKERDAVTTLLKRLETSIRDYLASREGPPVELAPPPREPSNTIVASPSENGSSQTQLQHAFDLDFPIDETCSTLPLSAHVYGQGGEDMSGGLIPTIPTFSPGDLDPFLDGIVETNRDKMMPTIPSCDDPIVPTSTPGCGCHPSSAFPNRSPDRNLWRLANAVLTPPVHPQRDGFQPDRDWQQDIPVRAVLHGWDAVEARVVRLPPLWSKLRQIDENLFYSCGKVERLAILRLMHSLLLYHHSPSDDRHALVPPWYLERPSQAISHSYAIDFFVWPGLRERFVFFQHRYCANLFWHLFASCLRLLWPFEFRDAYAVNIETGQFSLSEAFERRVRDINSWTMTHDIFAQWPELYSDIPAFPNAPGRLVSPKALVPSTGPWGFPPLGEQKNALEGEDEDHVT